jgi:hypothetical protein
MNNLYVFFLAILVWQTFTSNVAHADTACPPQKDGNPLSGASVFDGPPSELADLQADQYDKKQQHAIWDVRYLYDQGRTVYLECYYKDRKDLLIVKVDKVDQCLYSQDHAGKSQMSCK